MNKDNITISIVSPVYKSESLIDELVQRIRTSVGEITNHFEIVLVEDCGGDESWSKIVENCRRYREVKGVKLSRNFGQQHAIQAGIETALGDFIVVMDCDLQDRPEEIVTLYNKLNEGYDIVVASRVNRQDGVLKKLMSKAFNNTMSYLTDTKQDDSIANFFMITRQVVDTLASINDKNRYYPLLLQWIGFGYTKVPIPHASRADEKGSSYSIRKRLRLALDTILTFSEKPLRLTLKFGVLLSLLSFLLAIGLVIMYVFSEVHVPGWSSLVLLVSFLSGIIISILGMIGIYLGKTFEAVKDRPTYIIHKIVN